MAISARDPGAFGRFHDIYGYEITRWPGYPALREIREFVMVTWLIQKAAEDAQPAA
jgi:hypothetical protein